MQLLYDRKLILEEAQANLNLSATSYTTFVKCSIIHRFLRLSDAFCLLINDNVESAEHLLRPLLECSMDLFAISTSDDPEVVCRSIFEDERLDRVAYSGISSNKTMTMKDVTIAKEMDASNFYKGMEEFYRVLCRRTHFSQRHIAHLIRNTEEFSIGGDNTELHEPIISEAISDFNLTQTLFLNTLKFC